MENVVPDGAAAKPGGRKRNTDVEIGGHVNVMVLPDAEVDADVEAM